MKWPERKIQVDIEPEKNPESLQEHGGTKGPIGPINLYFLSALYFHFH